MNTEPEKTIRSLLGPLKKLMNQTPDRVLRFIIRNWQWKLLAVFLAVCLWAGLISQDATLTRERVFTDVPINVTGVDSLRRNSGLIVLSGLESENLTARMRVEVPQREYTTVTAANYNPRIELTRITEPGEQVLKVVSTSTSTYGVVQDITPSSVTLMVDEYVTNYRVPVSVETTGKHPEGFWGGTLSLDPSVVAVSGPRTVVDRIARVRVDFDLSSLSPRSGNVRIALPMRFLDAEDEIIESDLLEVTSAGVVLRTILLEQTLYPLQKVPLSSEVLTKGEPAEGYHVKKVSISPSVVKAAGDPAVLESLEKVFVDSALDISGAKESFSANVRLRRPSGVQMITPDMIVVTVQIEPDTASRTFENMKLSAEGASSYLRVKLDTRSVSAVLSGPRPSLEALRKADVIAYVDTAGLEAGSYELPVEIRVENADGESYAFSVTPATIQAELTAN